MAGANHFAADDVQAKLTLMEEKWQQLVTASTKKRDRLNEAYQVRLEQESTCASNLKYWSAAKFGLTVLVAKPVAVENQSTQVYTA